MPIRYIWYILMFWWYIWLLTTHAGTLHKFLHYTRPVCTKGSPCAWAGRQLLQMMTWRSWKQHQPSTSMVLLLMEVLIWWPGGITLIWRCFPRTRWERILQWPRALLPSRTEFSSYELLGLCNCKLPRKRILAITLAPFVMIFIIMSITSHCPNHKGLCLAALCIEEPSNWRDKSITCTIAWPLQPWSC